MRCKHCPYNNEYDWSENAVLCKLFGYGYDEITENRKREEGCKYNLKTLDKMFKEKLKFMSEHS